MGVKIFHVEYDGYIDTVVANDEVEAIACCVEDTLYNESDITSVVEIPESDWDNYKINIWEDNDYTKEPYEVTYREEVMTVGPGYIMASTNPDWTD